MSTNHRQTFLIVGATAEIAKPLCSRLAARGWRLVLAGRDMKELTRMADDFAVRYGSIFPTLPFDARDPQQTHSLIERAVASAETPFDGVVVCHGITPRESEGVTEAIIRDTCEVNFTSAAIILNAAAAHLEGRRAGVIAAISSVAGDRGRQSNALYGATKAALSTYLDGLRNRLHGRGIHVVTIKPGFVNTRMTRAMKPPFRFVVAAPDRVAADIERAIVQRRDVVYSPWFWRWIMAIICAIPEPLFKRLKL